MNLPPLKLLLEHARLKALFEVMISKVKSDFLKLSV